MRLAFFTASIGLGLAAISLRQGPTQAPYHWNLPRGFPEPLAPADNPMTDQKVELGRYLFYDPRLSVNGKVACATCHRQELAFTDGRPVGIGATGEHHPRGAMSLVNVAYSSCLTWSNPSLTRLEDQIATPMYGTHPVEMGLRREDPVPSAVQKDPTYARLFTAAFPEAETPVTEANIAKAIASFERSIISARSPYDRYHYGGDDHAISESAKHGEEMFFGERCQCFHCHGGFNFSDATTSRLTPNRRADFHNNGLYNLGGRFSYPSDNLGIYEYTKVPEDVGKFKAPTLRNIAITGPYMHDGSLGTLDDVLDHYAAGGRTIAAGPQAGIGSANPNKDGRVSGFKLNRRDRADLLAFLDSLTDPEVLHDPRFANPWTSRK